MSDTAVIVRFCLGNGVFSHFITQGIQLERRSEAQDLNKHKEDPCFNLQIRVAARSMKGRIGATFQALSVWQVATRVGKQKHSPRHAFYPPAIESADYIVWYTHDEQFGLAVGRHAKCVCKH